MTVSSSPSSSPASFSYWPTEIVYSKSQRVLNVTYDNGEKIALSAELLRVESPSAEVQGHRPEDKVIVTGKEHVAITTIHPVGRYAVRLVFDDGHQTGIYSWAYLYALARPTRKAG